MNQARTENAAALPVTLRKLQGRVARAMLSDRRPLLKELQQIGRLHRSKPPAGALNQRLSALEQRLRASVSRADQRRRNLPIPPLQTDLPISRYRDEIVAEIKRHPVVVLSGETGSGKTTQLPKFCLAAGRGVFGKIGCTQPRRIAATSVARRICEELDAPLGSMAGYKIRFQDRTSPDAYIKVMTDGILLAETRQDPDLLQYDTLIVDEAHERSLNIDFVIGILRFLLKRRRDLKVIITSATLDTQKFSQAFDQAPVIEVSGRTYPVEVRYEPADQPSTKKGGQTDGEVSHVEQAVAAVDRLRAESNSGDILVFMPTEQDIRETCELLEGRRYPAVRILPLFARLSGRDQAKVFGRGARKIIVATNIAETSITIPGIKYVVDTGLARIPRYLPRSRITVLPVLPVSRSSADQRMGRCGRVQNGVCIRLYSEQDYESRPQFTAPEIQRANLAEVILRMISLNLGDVASFPFIDPPAPKSITDGFELLQELGAIEKPGSSGRFRLTHTGAQMASLPLDPRLARMLIEARLRNCLEEMTVIAAALSIQDPRQRPAEKRSAADEAHGRLHHPASDFLTLLNMWNAYIDSIRKSAPAAARKRFCQTHYLSFRRMREWQDIHGQIQSVLKEHRMKAPVKTGEASPGGGDPDDRRYNAVHQSILSGFLSNIAVKKEANQFKAARGREVMLFPGSALFNKAATWIVAAEMVETSRLFARTAANIDVAWLERLGKHYCKSTYTQPHWERRRGEVVANEQVSLFGLIIVSGRKVSYGRIRPDDAAEIFVRSALVEGDAPTQLPFLKHNQRLVREIRRMEDKLRRRDLLVDEEDLVRFYRSKLPGCRDWKGLLKSIKSAGGDGFLRLSRADLLRDQPDTEALSQFPDRLPLAGRLLDVDYRFEPGEAIDGMTLQIPADIAGAIPTAPVEWLVPGLLPEKITALIKGLSKAHRRRLVPVNETVQLILKEMPRQPRPLPTVLSEFLHARLGVDIPASAWDPEGVPDHLKVRFSVIGPGGRELRAGRDKSVLKTSHSEADASTAGLAQAQKKWERTSVLRWEWSELPESIRLSGAQSDNLRAYPALVKHPTENRVDLRLLLDRQKALIEHPKGVAALLATHFSKELKFLSRHLTRLQPPAPVAGDFGGAAALKQQVYNRVCKTLFEKEIRTRQAFDAMLDATQPIILETGGRWVQAVLSVLEVYSEVRSRLTDLHRTHRFDPVQSAILLERIKELQQLLPRNFIELYDMDRLIHIERYLHALSVRAQRGVVNPDKDRSKAQRIRPFTEHLTALLGSLSPDVSLEKRTAVEALHWMIEEFKISIFAQEVGTREAVSEKRLKTKISEIERMV